MRQTLLLTLWAVLICCVVTGSLLPASAPPMAAIDRLHVNDKLLHFAAYLGLALLPALAFRNRRHAWYAAAAMFVLGIVLEAAQNFAPGRGVEMADIVANAGGILCGIAAARGRRM